IRIYDLYAREIAHGLCTRDRLPSPPLGAVRRDLATTRDEPVGHDVHHIDRVSLGVGHDVSIGVALRHALRIATTFIDHPGGAKGAELEAVPEAVPDDVGDPVARSGNRPKIRDLRRDLRSEEHTSELQSR